MCGIFGIIIKEKQAFSLDKLKPIVDDLFLLSESRGKEASGIAFLINNKVTVYKEPIISNKFIKKEKYRDLFNPEIINRKVTERLAVIGHSRLATNGFQTENRNNQPVIKSNILGIHNGIIVNDNQIFKRIVRKKSEYEVDTEALLELINHFVNQGLTFSAAAQKTFNLIEGSASVAVLKDTEESLLLATNTGSLYFIHIEEPDLFIFASEAFILNQIIKRNFEHPATPQHLKAYTGLLLDLSTLTMKQFFLDKKLEKKTSGISNKKPIFKITDISDSGEKADSQVINLYESLNNLNSLKKHHPGYRQIYNLKRCAKCILPLTTPFIQFDNKGVCNYCRTHKKIRYQGLSALEKLVEPHRSKNGEPDCIIALSGGRDSSYGLHFLKKELKMNPIAYTYDWGMVTDLARKNEARLVGKLGVEHIIISADITIKREHIRKHILAWMKKPDLGMVPLFMEGDKQCEYYADELSKKTGVKLIFFCRGNEFEKEEFKTGHCGIKNADPHGVIHNLPLSGKVQIAAYYGRQYLTNPSYINSSIFDTLFAYFSTYIQKHDYVFLWHYIPWEEQKILKTIKGEYNWQSSPETKATWRTDDGTSAFYNYIYYTAQGFTENDSFRSRQIREGILTRKEALSLVHEENKPRFHALKWYFDRVGLDGHEVLSVVDNMPKKY